MELWGSADIVVRDPEVRVYRNAVYVPYSPGQAWGVFDEQGQPLPATVDFRPGGQPSFNQICSVQLDTLGPIDEAPHGTYVYCGVINPHFGHFIINSLPRFWGVTSVRSPYTPILCHGPGTARDWFQVPFIRDIFGLLGLTLKDFTTFERPTRLANVVVMESSLKEQQAGHHAFARLCASIGSRVTASGKHNTNTNPVYYSKSRLSSAVGVITNEYEIEDFLSSKGVDIVYPETLSFVDQIRLMASRAAILGSSGSFLHASIFAPRRRIICLNVTSQINTNYRIIDMLAENQTAYLYPREMQVLDARPGFLTSRYLPAARQVAQELLDFV